MKSQYKIIGSLISILLIFPNQPIAATSVDCSPITTVVGNLTRLTFTAAGDCDWTVPANVQHIKFLMVAGGGGGGGGARGGGGGGGAVITSPGMKIVPGNKIAIKVGAGGNGGAQYYYPEVIWNQNLDGQNGGNSSIGTIVALGGGGGGGYFDSYYFADERNRATGKAGGNQGGGSDNSEDASASKFLILSQPAASALSANNNINVYGNNIAGVAPADYIKGPSFGAGGGGAGAGGAGSNVIHSESAGNGGPGIKSNITGADVFYGGGGGGGSEECFDQCRVTAPGAGTGGVGGGGAGGLTSGGFAGTSNSGGGGGGAGELINDGDYLGGAGGSGLIVITYENKICIEDGACSVGDIGPGGGRIFHIETSTNTAFEATPNFWPRTCAAGGLCNLGDTGFGGGTIFSIDSGIYREVSQNSLEFFGEYMEHSASAINATYPYPINGNIYGRWTDATLSDYWTLAIARKNFMLNSAPLQFRQGEYWTSDPVPYDPDGVPGQLLFYPLIGAQGGRSWFLDDRNYVRFFASHLSGDTTEAFANGDEWADHQTSTSIGSGAANTALLKSATSISAAQIASDLTLNGKSDWFLPSIGELQLLFNKRSTIEGFGNRNNIYWSSSSNSTFGANYMTLENPTRSFLALKYDEGAIRPIRSFSIAAAALPGVVLTMNSGLRTATYRTVNTISAVATEAGKVTFFADGKKIAGCISVQTNANTASCGWKPSVRKSQQLTARLKTSGGQYSTILTLEVAVVSRTTRR